jgi:hypothetical protein
MLALSFSERHLGSTSAQYKRASLSDLSRSIQVHVVPDSAGLPQS